MSNSINAQQLICFHSIVECVSGVSGVLQGFGKPKDLPELDVKEIDSHR